MLYKQSIQVQILFLKTRDFHVLTFYWNILHLTQIIRYNLGGTPLWVSGENIPTENNIPECTCGCKRQYEFQVLLYI